MLIGDNKGRPTYDQLDPMKWMAGCIKGALDLAQPDKDKNLEYLANLLEDASDFSFANAKACHAVVLTTMEADKLQWQDTEQLDRLRRQHAQKHPQPTNSNASQASSKKSDDSKKKSMTCKFALDGKCHFQETHFTRGVWYRHFCKHCSGEHNTNKCTAKSKNM